MDRIPSRIDLLAVVRSCFSRETSTIFPARTPSTDDIPKRVYLRVSLSPPRASAIFGPISANRTFLTFVLRTGAYPSKSQFSSRRIRTRFAVRRGSTATPTLYQYIVIETVRR